VLSLRGGEAAEANPEAPCTALDRFVAALLAMTERAARLAMTALAGAESDPIEPPDA
jgi:hypothetical protein